MNRSTNAAVARHPAYGKTVVAAGLSTNYLEAGQGFPVVLLHGSGVGVSAYENWHRIIPRLAIDFRVLAPDIVGFGLTERPECQYSIKLWVEHLLGFLDALGLARAVLVGNSFGGGLSLATSMRNSQRIERMILMGTPAGDFIQKHARDAARISIRQERRHRYDGALTA